MKNLPKVFIALGSNPRIVVDGMDLTKQVNFVNIQQDARSGAPMVSLGIMAEVEFEGDVDVEYLRPEVAFETFFSTVDPAKLEAEALESELAEGPNGVVKAILSIIRREVSGSEP